MTLSTTKSDQVIGYCCNCQIPIQLGEDHTTTHMNGVAQRCCNSCDELVPYLEKFCMLLWRLFVKGIK